MKNYTIIDDNFLFARFFWCGYDHRPISGSLNFIKNICQIFFGQAIHIYVLHIFSLI